MGLNRVAGDGNSNTKYFGEYYMAQLALAKNAVVVLNRLCYASGNNEWGAGNPTKSTAIERVDNYGVGFIGAGAKAVFASGITDVGYVVRGLFGSSSSTTLGELFWSRSGADRRPTSSRSPRSAALARRRSWTPMRRAGTTGA